ncbi:MAG: ABC transporter transmembrane domain-containing protein, partial [Gemmatimonadaceae bacterium]
MPQDRPRSSRRRYLGFVEDYKHRRLDEATDAAQGKKPLVAGAGSSSGDPASPAATAGETARGKKKHQKHRKYVGDYLRWLRPHRYAVAGVFTLALAVAGLQMIEPLFMRFIIDHVLLTRGLDAAERMRRLNLAGTTFLAVIIVSNGFNTFKDYRQRLLNVRLMLSLRRSLFDRLLHLPLPKLWDMKTGGILSRLSGDVETTTGLFQMAIVSPAVSVIRLVIAVVVLMSLNWRLGFTALAIIPGVMLMSFTLSRRVRPIYRSVRKDAEHIDGRVGETFSGIRVVRAFRAETSETLEYMRGRHTVLRKELFAHRRELVLWLSWGLLMSGVNVVIVWYGGALTIAGGASVGDIMAFQWYTFLILNPVWNIVNSFSELQRSLAAMERVFEVLMMPADKPDHPGAVD